MLACDGNAAIGFVERICRVADHLGDGGADRKQKVVVSGRAIASASSMLRLAWLGNPRREIAPDENRQFENTGDEPLGFLCVAPARRP